MTAPEMKPLSQRLVAQIHNEQGYGWTLESLMPETQSMICEVESLEAEVEQLQVKADKFDQIKSAMGWLADPSADIILMEISTYRQSAKNYKEKKEVAESALREAQGTHAEMGELLKYFEINKQFPPESYAIKWDYNTALHIWVKYDLSHIFCTDSDVNGEENRK